MCCQNNLPGSGTGVVIRWCRHTKIHPGAFNGVFLSLGSPCLCRQTRLFTYCQDPRLCPPREYSFFFPRLLCSPLKEASISQKSSPTSATTAFHSASASQKLMSRDDAGMLCSHSPFLSSFVPTPFTFAKNSGD